MNQYFKIQFSFIVFAFCTLFGVSRPISWRPSPACLRRGPGGCFRGKCYTAWWRANSEPRVNRIFPLTHQRPGKLASIRYDTTGNRN